jgi:two-component system sensor histidine kinase DegS
MKSYYQSIFGLTIDGQILGMNDKRFTPEVEIALFRFFQEGLNNVIKHAGVNSVECKLIYSYPRIIAIVADRGVGFDTSKRKLGVGLRIMQRRVGELGGTLTIKSKPGEGTQIRAVIPYNGSSASHADGYESKVLESVHNRFAVRVPDGD